MLNRQYWLNFLVDAHFTLSAGADPVHNRFFAEYGVYIDPLDPSDLADRLQAAHEKAESFVDEWLSDPDFEMDFECSRDSAHAFYLLDHYGNWGISMPDEVSYYGECDAWRDELLVVVANTVDDLANPESSACKEFGVHITQACIEYYGCDIGTTFGANVYDLSNDEVDTLYSSTDSCFGMRVPTKRFVELLGTLLGVELEPNESEDESEDESDDHSWLDEFHRDLREYGLEKSKDFLITLFEEIIYPYFSRKELEAYADPHEELWFVAHYIAYYVCIKKLEKMSDESFQAFFEVFFTYLDDDEYDRLNALIKATFDVEVDFNHSVIYEE